MNIFSLLISYYARFIRQRACPHLHEFIEIQKDGAQAWRTKMVEVGSHIVLDDWQPPEPHPHPKFSHRCKVQRQPIAALAHCKHCGKLWIEKGYNQRDVEEDLPGLSPVRMPGSTVL